MEDEDIELIKSGMTLDEYVELKELYWMKNDKYHVFKQNPVKIEILKA